jgi:hypothetical protein
MSVARLMNASDSRMGLPQCWQTTPLRDLIRAIADCISNSKAKFERGFKQGKQQHWQFKSPDLWGQGLKRNTAIREIAICLHRTASTVSPEGSRHGGRSAYRAYDADQQDAAVLGPESEG